MGKISKIVGAVNAVRKADNPGQAVGNLAAGAAMISHPIIGTLAAPAIRKGTEKAVNKGIQMAHDPNVQAKAKEVASNVTSRVTSGVRDVVDKGRSMTFGNSH